MDTIITINSLLNTLSTLVLIVAGIGAIIALYNYIVKGHDQVQKWNEYDNDIKQIREEQYILTFCMRGVLDGLHQLNCNGKVTEAKDKLDEYMDKQAHGVSNG